MILLVSTALLPIRYGLKMDVITLLKPTEINLSN